MTDLPAVMSLLRACTIRVLVNPSPKEDLTPLLARVNWNHVLWLGRQHRVLLCLHDLLTGPETGLVPPGVAAQINIIRQANQLRLLGRSRELCLLQDLFDREGIEVCPLNGWMLAQRHYERPGLREVGGRISYGVRRVDRARAETALSRIGYDLKDDPLRLADGRRSRIVLYSPPENGADAHGDATGRLWDELEAFPFGGRILRPPSPTDWLLYLCSRGVGHLWWQLRRAGDVVALVRSNPLINWDNVFDRATHTGLQSTVLLGVATSHRILGLSIPPGLENRLDANPPISRCAEMLARHTLRGVPRSPDGLAALRPRLMLQPTLARKWRCVVQQVRAAIRPQTALMPSTGNELAYIGRFYPTPKHVASAMLRLAGTTETDVVYDLGCGDGRVVIAAAKEFGARGVGLDIDPQRIAEARLAAASEGVSERVSLACADVLKTRLVNATVVCIYLQGFAYAQIRRKLERELPAGTRVVSHDFIFPNWPPEKTEIILSSPLKVSQIYLWRIGDP